MRELESFVASNPPVLAWSTRLAKKSPKTSLVYTRSLLLYWKGHLSKRYPSLRDWAEDVKQQLHPMFADYETNTRWARELEDWVSTRVSRYNKPLSAGGRALIFWSVRSFLASLFGG